MTEDTPQGYEQITVETIDEVLPRLQLFTKKLVQQLSACGIRIGITTIYLLDSIEHPIEVPGECNGVPIQISFDATLRVWDGETPKARIGIRFNHGTPFYYVEKGRPRKGAPAPFLIKNIVFRFIRELRKLERAAQIQRAKDTTKAAAEVAFQHLADKLGVPLSVEDPSFIDLSKKVKIKRLDQTPTIVLVIVNVTHNEALDLAKKFS